MKGFTLIETIIYIALLAVLLSGAIEGTYQLLRSSDVDGAKALTEQEGSFVLNKVAWALMSTSSTAHILSPAKNSCSSGLSLITPAGERVDICRVGSHIKMREGSNVALPCTDSSYLPLTSDSTNVSLLQFFYNSQGEFEASTSMNGVTFSTKKFVE